MALYAHLVHDFSDTLREITRAGCLIVLPQGERKGWCWMPVWSVFECSSIKIHTKSHNKP